MSSVKLLLLLFILTAIPAAGQKELNTWYFGEHAGIDFTSGHPVALHNGSIYTNEGCSGICDPKGNLLFYTDGVTVWDKTHHIIANGTGLHGNSSSTQSAIVVRKPRSLNLYYIFTIDCAEDSMHRGLQYSIVDMNRNGGKGEVISKNNRVYAPTGEKLTAIQQKGSSSVWIVIVGYTDRDFYSYLLTAHGLDMVPIRSKGMRFNSAGYNGLIGYMKASADGSKLAIVSEYNGYITVFSFDAVTGRAGNCIFYALTSAPYGVEFSANGKMLYTTENTIWLRQYNLDSLYGDSITYFGSNKTKNLRYLVDSSSYILGALQLGPDKKIYVSMAPDYVGAIDFPDLAGPACRFDSAAVHLDSGAHATLGLPAYLASYFYTLFSYTDTCFGSATHFSITDNSHIDSVHWNFGDSATGRFNTSKQLSSSHVFSHTGLFKVAVTTYIEGVALDDTLDVTITKPEANLGPDTSLCCICHDTIRLNAFCEGCTYRWNDGATSSARSITTAGDYWVSVNSRNCSTTDTIHISGTTRPLFAFRDTAVCDSFTLVAKYSSGNNHYRWQDGTVGSRYTTYNSGIYYVTATNECAELTDTVNVIITNCDCYLYIPNSFTPDHNGLNEIFKPSLCSAEKYQMEIFNRWGEKLFETHDLQTGWNGTFNGKAVEEGVYIYHIKGYNHYTGFIEKKGIVNLLRAGN